MYITTPIYYPNDKPHLGSVYTTVLADFLARYFRKKEETFFLTGTDEHGLKLQQEAEKRGKKPKEFVDEMVVYFKDAWEKFEISYDRFIRTTDPDHEETVKYVAEKLYEKGLIYLGKYQGWYCVRCEKYFSEDEVLKKDGKFLCPVHLTELEWMEEETYFFALSKFKDYILELLRKEKWILPEVYKYELFDRCKDLKDLCVARPKERVYWGIELPFDKKYTIYVWLDALLNYLTGIGYLTEPEKFKKFWPAVHLIGKDILWFHAVIWPAILKGLDLEPPKRILVHGFWTVRGLKMGKSLGNIIYYEDLLVYGADAMRYFLIRVSSPEKDSDFSWEEFRKVYTTELVNNIGNTVRRVLTLGKKFGELKGENEFENEIKKLEKECEKCVEEFKPSQYILNILHFFNELNAYFQQKEPWKTNDINSIYSSICAVLKGMELLEPVIPEAAKKVFESIEIKEDKIVVKDAPLLFKKI